MSYEHNERARKGLILSLVWEGVCFRLVTDEKGETMTLEWDETADAWVLTESRLQWGDDDSRSYRFDWNGRLGKVWEISEGRPQTLFDLVKSTHLQGYFELEATKAIGQFEFERQKGAQLINPR